MARIIFDEKRVEPGEFFCPEESEMFKLPRTTDACMSTSRGQGCRDIMKCKIFLKMMEESKNEITQED